MDLTKLKTAATEAADLAQQLATDPHQSRSQFAAAIRSALDHANSLIAGQETWFAANPVPTNADGGLKIADGKNTP